MARNWRRDHDRRRMQRQGAEDHRDTPAMMAPLMKRRPPRPKVSKADLRAAAEAAKAIFDQRKR